jgi:RsiW-degrading membrane proteinase PrsW (M82 family)
MDGLAEIYLVPIAAFVGFSLSAIWLVFFLLEDRENPEPRFMITRTFALGILAALFAAFVEKLFSIFGSSVGIDTNSMPDLMGNAFIEETIKFLIVLCFISWTKWFD